MALPSKYTLNQICILLMTSLLPIHVHGNPDAKRLYDDLIMKGYNKHCRPVSKFLDVTMVTLGLSLSQIVNVVRDIYIVLLITKYSLHSAGY